MNVVLSFRVVCVYSVGQGPSSFTETDPRRRETFRGPMVGRRLFKDRNRSLIFFFVCLLFNMNQISNIKTPVKCRFVPLIVNSPPLLCETTRTLTYELHPRSLFFLLLEFISLVSLLLLLQCFKCVSSPLIPNTMYMM